MYPFVKDVIRAFPGIRMTGVKPVQEASLKCLEAIVVNVKDNETFAILNTLMDGINDPKFWQIRKAMFEALTMLIAGKHVSPDYAKGFAEDSPFWTKITGALRGGI